MSMLLTYARRPAVMVGELVDGLLVFPAPDRMFWVYCLASQERGDAAVVVAGDESGRHATRISSAWRRQDHALSPREQVSGRGR